MSFVDEILQNPLRRKMLGGLCSLMAGASGLALARRSGLNPRQAYSVLGEFEELGLVERRRRGAASLFRLNWDNSLAAKLRRRFSAGWGEARVL